MKIRPLRAELSYAEGEADVLTSGQTDIMKVIAAFYIFVNIPKTTISSKCGVVSFILHFLILFFKAR
jgi:hypothetical protein